MEPFITTMVMNCMGSMQWVDGNPYQNEVDLEEECAQGCHIINIGISRVMASVLLRNWRP